MLPSAGIFSRIPCPYFEEGHCVRPFCEFFHKPPGESFLFTICTLERLKSNFITDHHLYIVDRFAADEDEPSEKPSYRPTPIAIPALDTQDKEEAGQIKKRPKLEYIPLPVTIKPPVYKPSVIPPVATYIPTKITPEIVEETPEKADEDLDKSLELVIDEGIETNISAAEIQESNSETDIKKEKKSSRRHSHSSSKSSRHHKSSRHESSSSSSSRHHKSSRHKSSSRRSSSSSKESSSRKHKSKSDKSSKPTEKPKEEPIDLVASEEENEEDIEEQCRMIFETYQAPEKSEEIPQQPKPSKSTDSEESSTYVNDKKRLAHENSANVERPTTSLRTNHSHSALKLAHKRQDIAMQSALEELQRKNEEIQRLEAEIKKRQEEKEALTPLVNPLVFHRAKARPVISKISQIMQIEAAKKRVADLNKAKADRFQSFTPSQTANKWSNRTAHTPTNISDIDPLKLAPPFKEPNSSKISSNVRNQYYKIMVTHCLQIYSLPEDAYERAQNEEYTVFQKCKMVQTYKTSALLAISRLKKEAESGSAEKKNLKTFSHDVMLAGKQGLKNSWSTNHKIKVNNSESSLVTIDNCSSSQAYSLFAECILTEQQLKDNGFPRATEMAGKAKIFTPKKAKPQSAREGDYYCSRCHKVFNVEIYDEPGTDMCNFHAKRSGYRRGFADNLYYCCQQPVGSDGW